jgi:hypothetical protein
MWYEVLDRFGDVLARLNMMVESFWRLWSVRQECWKVGGKMGKDSIYERLDCWRWRILWHELEALTLQ